MVGNGAVKLRKVLTKLRAGAMPQNVAVIQHAPDILRIEKKTGSGQEPEFTFYVRIERVGGTELWWPIEYNSPGHSDLRSETQVNGRLLVNLQTQKVLVDLAEEWAGTLEALSVAKTIGNALL